MKKFARLVLFTLLAFLLIFVCSMFYGFLQLWISAAATVPVRRAIYLAELVNSAKWVLSLSLYGTVLLSMSYAQRNRLVPLVSFLTVIGLSGGLAFAAAKGLMQASLMSAPPYAVTSGTLGNAGLMLRRGDTVITLLDRPALETGSRVVAVAGRPLVYQEIPFDENQQIISLPEIQFSSTSDILDIGIQEDLSLSAGEMLERFDDGIFSFFVWLCPLLVLLAALSYMFEVGAWPLANLCICAVIFRGILLFEVFLNSKGIQGFLVDFVRGLVPTTLLTPILFAVLAALFLLYDILMYFARERGKYSDV